MEILEDDYNHTEKVKKNLEDLLDFIDKELKIQKLLSNSPNKKLSKTVFFENNILGLVNIHLNEENHDGIQKKHQQNKNIFYHTFDNSTFYTSASPKKKDFNNIKAEKNHITFTNSQHLSNSVSRNLKNKFSIIELKLRAYLKESQDFFKSNLIENFITEYEEKDNISIATDFDKFKNLNLDSGKTFKKSENLQSNVSSIHYNTNIQNGSSIPSIFKNFFEEKDNKELNKKRHSMALGVPLLNNKLKNNFSNCEFKQKYQSNHDNNNAKLNFGFEIDNKNSSVSNFSLDINFNDNNSGFEIEDECLVKKEIKVIKRNSIMKERLTRMNFNNFGVVEEEKNNNFSGDESEEEKFSDKKK